MTPKIQISNTVDKAQKIILPEYCKYNGNRNTALRFDLSDSKKQKPFLQQMALQNHILEAGVWNTSTAGDGAINCL